jgi:nitrogen regulatory protein PII
MELLIVILNREDYLQKILSLLVESGASGATILDSEGLGHFLAYEVPIFAGLRHLVGERKSANKTILAVLEDVDIFDTFKKLLIEENIDFTKPGVGVIITLPVNEVIKAKKETQII